MIWLLLFELDEDEREEDDVDEQEDGEGDDMLKFSFCLLDIGRL